ncbi:MAG: hypothetical protein ACI3ZQ_00855 [Candidatus Cryptobacteroides sp.]
MTWLNASKAVTDCASCHT